MRYLVELWPPGPGSLIMMHVRGGHIWLGYDSSVLNLVSSRKDEQFMHYKVMGLLIPTHCFLSCVYARYEEVDQARLWVSLKEVGMSICDDSWLIIGDFNVCHHALEMRGVNTSSTLGIRRFNNLLAFVLL